MDFYEGAVKSYKINVIREYLLSLEFFKDSGKDTGIYPSPHTVINGMPRAKLFGDSPPFAAVFEDIKDTVEDLEIGILNVSAWLGKAVCYLSVLPSGNFHAEKLADSRHSVN